MTNEANINGVHSWMARE